MCNVYRPSLRAILVAAITTSTQGGQGPQIFRSERISRLNGANPFSTCCGGIVPTASTLVANQAMTAMIKPRSVPSCSTGSNPAKSDMYRPYSCPAGIITNQSCRSATRLLKKRRAMAIPSSRGILKRAKLASPSPLHLHRSWIEYFDSKIARVIRVIRGSATVPLSKPLRGVKPQQIAASTAESKRGWYSRS